jgi:chromosome segregation ATPase
MNSINDIIVPKDPSKEIKELKDTLINISPSNSESDTSKIINSKKVFNFNSDDSKSKNSKNSKYLQKLKENKYSNKKSFLPPQSNSILCKKLQKEIDSLNYQISILNKKNNELENENAYAKNEIQKLNNIKENEIKTLIEKEESLNTKIKLKEQDIENLNKQIEENKKNKFDYENLKETNRELNIENENLKTTLNNLNKLTETLKNDIQNYKNQIEEINGKNNTLKNDRVYVLNDAFVSKEKNKELINENELLKRENNEYKNVNDTLLVKIENYENLKEDEYKERLNKMKENLENKYKNDIEKLNSNLSKLNESKIKFLSQQNNELKEKLLNKEKELNLLITSNDKDSLEKQSYINSLKDEIEYNKIQMKIKEEDLKRLNNVYNENIKIIEYLQNENKILKEKNKVLIDEFHNMISQSKDNEIALNNKIKLLESQNKDYEQFESELDKLLINNSITSITDEKSIEFINSLKNLPENNKKRISQCILLTTRIQELNIEINKLKNDYNDLLNENKKLKDENFINKNIASQMKDPYEYLINQLNEKNNMIEKYEIELEDLNKKLKAILNENQYLNDKLNDTEKDLKTILTNRNKIEELEFLVRKIVSDESLRRGKKEEIDQLWDIYFPYRNEDINKNINFSKYNNNSNTKNKYYNS